MKKRNSIVVTVEYPYRIKSVVEEQLEMIAKRNGGNSPGAGVCFMTGVRDIDFSFKNVESATTFKKEAKKFLSSYKQVKIHL